MYLFPNFGENLRQDFRRETELFFDSILRENRSVLELLTADYTFVNERLAKHYGIPNVYGSQFRRVTIADENRRGLLGQGSILTVTSLADRTTVVGRGKWILENLLGAPPPPPPPDVPPLEENKSGGKVLTLRERMEQHRANPVCASCHARMDPLGFALENFDATGQWRTHGRRARRSTRRPMLPDGTQFEGPAGLRNDAARPVRAGGDGDDREAADLRARPRPRVLRCCRPCGRSSATPRGDDYQLPVADPRRREERAVQDETPVAGIGGMIEPN